MRQVFPRLRVIATTHDPLCLQETDSGEVVRMERVEGEGVTAVPLDVPKGLRADQLLTGDWFRLTATTDNDTARLQEEYGRLLLEKRTKPNLARRAEIEGTLRLRTNGFAETSVERVALQVTAQLARGRDVEVTTARRAEREELASMVLAEVKKQRG